MKQFNAAVANSNANIQFHEYERTELYSPPMHTRVPKKTDAIKYPVSLHYMHE